MLNCPECDKALRADAFKCSCGWVKPPMHANNRPVIDCAHIGCRQPAMCRVKKPTGWANLCIPHYTDDNLAESREYCRQHGLVTVEDKMNHIKSLLHKPKDPRAWMKRPKSQMAAEWAAKLQNRAMREPGEDDEMREAA